ncbi:MAG: cytochrome b/b6 domain-containing protein [Sulfurimonadaceae bacterium]|jgi:cytochrome b561|nr:cytochrome b/b6 domain-containing protein [Sulfurimonadaceae bacterium]
MYYSLSFRIWHWLHAFVVLALLGTVFLRKTFLSYRQNSEIIIQKLQEFGIELSKEHAVIIAKTIRAEMWQWHIYLGYALAFLLLFRLVLAFTNSKPKVLFNTLSLHEKGVQISYYLLYGVLGFMALSGFGIYFYQELGFTKDFAHTLKEIHEFSFNFVLYFALLHVMGVVVAEFRGEKGIISRMIHGEKA